MACSIRVVSRDRYANARSYTALYGADVRSFSAEHSAKSVLDGTLVDDKDGGVTLTFTTTLAGEYKLHTCAPAQQLVSSSLLTLGSAVFSGSGFHNVRDINMPNVLVS